MMQTTNDAREIAALVPMGRLLESLGFAVDERTRRAPCLLHSGSNPTAFSWTESGLWRCHSTCGRGGDRIALVRAVRRCSFREAVEYLAVLAGVEYRSRRISRREIAEKHRRRARAERAAWQISDEIGRLRRYYTDTLHRAERLQARIGDQLLRASTESEREAGWERLAQLAPTSAFFCAAWNVIADAKPEILARFALASPAERRRFILEGEAA
jgi:phage/plasmid primase-like uncharacterized protein